MKQLTYDYTFMRFEVTGEHGVTDDEVTAIMPQVIASAQRLNQTPPSFTKLPYDTDTLHIVKALAETVSQEFENLLVLGIGGSDLGARAVLSALKSPFATNSESTKGMQVYFLGGNTDPQEIADVLAYLDLRKTAINIISKSGDTIEPMATFLLVRQKMIDQVGIKQHAKHIIATTDAEKGTMREIVNQNGYRSLVVPNDVGGRFSVLSSVGLFPLACAGIDSTKLFAGAALMHEHMINSADTLNIAQTYAVMQYCALQKGRTISVLMPYAERLRQFGFWYRQLWAESLGKKLNATGKNVNVGPTPIAALGATDQHSQMQLYNEGPFDKVITFIRVKDFAADFTVPTPLEDIEGVVYMAGHAFSTIINTEAQASAITLSQNGRPNGTIYLPRINEGTMGELIMFFEWATAYMGELLEINTYDQPGVEAGKTAMYALLGRAGYDARKKELEQFIAGKQYIV